MSIPIHAGMEHLNLFDIKLQPLPGMQTYDIIIGTNDILRYGLLPALVPDYQEATFSRSEEGVVDSAMNVIEQRLPSRIGQFEEVCPLDDPDSVWCFSINEYTDAQGTQPGRTQIGK
jgi:hypothetical protein